MKKLVLLGIVFALVFVFSLTLTLELYAFEEPTEPDPVHDVICCSYTTWCGTVGHGSLVAKFSCQCWLPPSSPYYSPSCTYECAADCPAE